MLSLFLNRLARGAAQAALVFAVAVLVLGGPGVLVPQLASRAFAQTEPGVAEEAVGDEADIAAEEITEEVTEDVEEELEGEEDDAAAKADSQLGAALGLTVLSAASILGGALFFGASADDRDLAAFYRPTDPDNANTLHERSDREKILGISLVTLGGALAAGAIYMWVTRADDMAHADDEDGGDDVTWAPTFGFDGSVGIVGTF